jgi:hypothetical protein
MSEKRYITASLKAENWLGSCGWRTPWIPALGRQRQADLWVWGQPGLQSEFQDSQDYTRKPCLEKQQQQQQTKNKKTKKKKKNKKATLFMVPLHMDETK